MQKDNLHYHPTYEKLSREISELILLRVKESDPLHLGLATGQSPKMVYEIFGDLLRKNPALIPRIRIFQLDEWLGLSGSNPSSCQYYLHKHVISSWQLEPGQYYLIDGQHSYMEHQITEMRNYLNKNPLDLCILGMGKNGHLAFNEPGSQLVDECRVVDLANASKKHQMIKGLATNPDKGITIGLKEIMAAKELVLIVSGAGKEAARKQLLDNTSLDKFPAAAVYKHLNYSIHVDQKPPN